MVRCAFSIKYEDPDDPYAVWAADWDYWVSRRWSRSFRDINKGIIVWYSGQEFPELYDLDEKGYLAILKHFGIENLRAQLPLDVIVKMSPAELVQKRREQEKKLGLKHLRVISDTMGDPRPAEEYT